jgi:hypothetical protein
MSDPQTSMCTVMKPPQGFETWMQGQPVGVAAAVPIPMIPVEGDQVTINDNIPAAAGPHWDPLMIRYLPVPMASTVLIWFPRLVWEEDNGGELVALHEVSYRYQLRWRLRSLQDREASGSQKVYTLPGSLGANTAPSNSAQQYAVPAAFGQVITPALPANYNGNLAINQALATMADSQGFYGKGMFPLVPDFPRGPIFYEPVQIAAVGDELAIYAYRDICDESEAWDFTAGGVDTGFSTFYGVGIGAQQHPWYPNHGIYVATQGRATFP